MLENLFWLIVFPFALAFIVGFMSYGLSGTTHSASSESGETSDSV